MRSASNIGACTRDGNSASLGAQSYRKRWCDGGQIHFAPPAGPHNHVLVQIWYLYTYLDELVVGVLSGPQKENPPKRSLKERNSLAPMISSSTQLLKLSIIVYYREERKERK